jgi:hypothetical protein
MRDDSAKSKNRRKKIAAEQQLVKQVATAPPLAT